MELYEVLFLIGFLGSILFSIAKLINVLNGWDYYDVKQGIIIFILFIISWGVMFFTTILYTSATVLILMQMFKLSNLFFGLNSIFTITEIIISSVRGNYNNQRKRYNAKDLLDYRV